jgi:hypothetical protein
MYIRINFLNGTIFDTPIGSFYLVYQPTAEEGCRYRVGETHTMRFSSEISKEEYERLQKIINPKKKRNQK